MSKMWWFSLPEWGYGQTFRFDPAVNWRTARNTVLLHYGWSRLPRGHQLGVL